ncbi:FMN-binding negative transcriptional regulator [Alcaligenaceae bacterium SJ-26]|nr:FMN-binding negative transcriptional regulator [Alcaligenaceae bacterium SJ-26]
MYIPAHFSETRPEMLARIIHRHPLGMLVTHDASGLDVNHLPFEFDADAGSHGILTAHVARANPVWQRSLAGQSVMVVFRGAEGYISPNWYPSKQEMHRQVPTWNYEVVHAHGMLTVRDDERFVRGVVARLTRRHEIAEARPWKMSDAPPEFIEQMLHSIVGLEIAVTALSGKRKLSQNKDERDRLGAVEALESKGAIELASNMRNPAS